jgi:hypothetical protein
VRNRRRCVWLVEWRAEGANRTVRRVCGEEPVVEEKHTVDALRRHKAPPPQRAEPCTSLSNLQCDSGACNILVLVKEDHVQLLGRSPSFPSSSAVS